MADTIVKIGKTHYAITEKSTQVYDVCGTETKQTCLYLRNILKSGFLGKQEKTLIHTTHNKQWWLWSARNGMSSRHATPKLVKPDFMKSK